jgi:hypothetical protein
MVAACVLSVLLLGVFVAVDAAAIPRDHRVEHRAPSVGAVDVARSQRAPFQIASLRLEHGVRGQADRVLEALHLQVLAAPSRREGRMAPASCTRASASS